VSPALGGVEQGRLNNKNFPSPKKILAKPKQAGKKKKGSGENEFLPACQPCEAGLGWERFRYSAVSRIAKQKNFLFLLKEKRTREKTKKCRENFSVLPVAVAP